MNRLISHSPAETREIGRRIAAALTPGTVLALEGDLGMGKTCLTEGIARGLGYEGEVNSPTFALVNEYKGGRLDLYHFDMYRVTGWEDLYSTGFFDYLDAASGLPAGTVTVVLTALPDGGRAVEVKGMDI